MTAGRTSLVLENPFFGTLALSLTMREDTTCETAWVNGRELGYNPTFVESLNHSTVTALIAHEVYHCAMGHPWRRDGRDPKGWNVAADKSINGELRDSGFTLPADVLFPSSSEQGKSAEWIYARIQQNDNGQGGQGQGPQGQGNPAPGQGNHLGEVRDAPTSPDADGEPAPTEQDWKQKTASALQQAKMCGKMPAGLARQVGTALRARIDVRSLLLRFFSERSTGDYSWTRPNPRYISQGLYLPALESKALGEIAIFIDTSGSVDQTSLAYACGIVQSVLDECDPNGVNLYFADTKVCHVERLEKGDPLTWTPKGGGGTDFRPVFDAIDSEGTAVCAVCISDLDGVFPPVPPSIPCIWLSTEDGVNAPFGETIYIDR
jgi:predicted metal-dependent peptidase